jgi:hypothetical protein
MATLLRYGRQRQKLKGKEEQGFHEQALKIVMSLPTPFSSTHSQHNTPDPRHIACTSTFIFLQAVSAPSLPTARVQKKSPT